MRMKSFYALMGGLLLMACGGGSGAKDALQDYMDAMQNKDYEAFVDGMNFKEEPTDDQKKVFAAMIAEKAKEKEDVKEYKVLRDSVLVEDSLAVVFYEVIYNDGKTDTEKQRMVKKDGKWLMEVVN